MADRLLQNHVSKQTEIIRILSLLSFGGAKVTTLLFFFLHFFSVPQFAQEFLMLFHDWYPDTNIQDLYAYQYGLTTYRMFGYNSSTCESYEPSTIINGRGMCVGSSVVMMFEEVR